MDSTSTRFDWVGWYTTIPGIPAGWGDAPAATGPAPAVLALAVMAARIDRGEAHWRAA